MSAGKDVPWHVTPGGGNIKIEQNQTKYMTIALGVMMASRIKILILIAILACSTAANAEWRVDIESKSVAAGEDRATVEFTIYWSEAVQQITIPVVVREIDPGSFWDASGTLPYDYDGSSYGVTWSWPEPSWATIIQELRPWEGCATPGGAYDGTSPDNFAINAQGPCGVTTANPDGSVCLTIAFDVNTTLGQFEFDTACAMEYLNYIYMVDCQFPPINHGPEGTDEVVFNKGIITIAPDPDGDGVVDAEDNCPSTYNPGQENNDTDSFGDACDNCPIDDNEGQENNDGDAYGDVCDDDDDNDEVLDVSDNCPFTMNPDQENNDGDTYGDACDDDDDNDTILDLVDNCVFTENTGQENSDGDYLGDACDNCPLVDNPGQEDGEDDGIGDVCDNCPEIVNSGQENNDSDSYGDACDNCPTADNEDQLNSDADSYGDVCDNCPDTDNEDQLNSDADTYGDVCDNCPEDENEDQLNSDGDTHGDVCDNCPLVTNEGQEDLDGDGIGDVCDDDIDGDGIPNSFDNCELTYNPDQDNHDTDEYGDLCDDDDDDDGLLDGDDNCPINANEFQEDMDEDGIGDVCDNDIDGDGVLNQYDNCDYTVNPEQDDNDLDGLGNACDDDDDNDGVPDVSDNCEFATNPGQDDGDSDGIGDECDRCPSIPVHAGAADLLAPYDGELDIAASNFTLEWIWCEGSYYTQVGIATDASMTSVIWTKSLSGSSTLYSGAPLTEGTEYFWSVRHRDGTVWGPFVTANSFTIEVNAEPLPPPMLYFPVNGSDLALPNEFSWEQVEGAAEYIFELSADPGMATLLESLSSAVNSVAIPLYQGMSEGTTYYWRVIPIDGFGFPGGVSDTWSFDLVPSCTVPGVVTADYPDDLFVDTGPELILSWQSVAGASCYDLQYTLGDPTFATQNINLVDCIANLSYTLEPLGEGTVYWRVRGRDGECTGDWSGAGEMGGWSHYCIGEPSCDPNALCCGVGPMEAVGDLLLGETVYFRTTLNTTCDGTFSLTWTINGTPMAGMPTSLEVVANHEYPIYSPSYLITSTDPLDVRLVLGTSTETSLLVADFDDKTIDAPIGTGGAAVGEPVYMYPPDIGIVRDNPMTTPSLEIPDVSVSDGESVWFTFINSEQVGEGTLVARMDLWLTDTDPHIINFGTDWATPVLGLNFRLPDLIVLDGIVPFKVCELELETDEKLSLMVVFHRDRKGYDLWLNGELVFSDNLRYWDAEAPIGQISMYNLKDNNSSGAMYVDNISVDWYTDVGGCRGASAGDFYPQDPAFIPTAIKVIAEKTILAVGGTDETQLTVKLLNEDGGLAAVDDQSVDVAIIIGGGTITMTPITTTLGQATTTYQSALTTGLVTVQASAPGADPPISPGAIKLVITANPLDQMVLSGYGYLDRLENLEGWPDYLPGPYDGTYLSPSLREFIDTRVDIETPADVDTNVMRRVNLSLKTLSSTYGHEAVEHFDGDEIGEFNGQYDMWYWASRGILDLTTIVNKCLKEIRTNCTPLMDCNTDRTQLCCLEKTAVQRARYQINALLSMQLSAIANKYTSPSDPVTMVSTGYEALTEQIPIAVGSYLNSGGSFIGAINNNEIIYNGATTGLLNYVEWTQPILDDIATRADAGDYSGTLDEAATYVNGELEWVNGIGELYLMSAIDIRNSGHLDEFLEQLKYPPTSSNLAYIGHFAQIALDALDDDTLLTTIWHPGFGSWELYARANTLVNRAFDPSAAGPPIYGPEPPAGFVPLTAFSQRMGSAAELASISGIDAAMDDYGGLAKQTGMYLTDSNMPGLQNTVSDLMDMNAAVSQALSTGMSQVMATTASASGALSNYDNAITDWTNWIVQSAASRSKFDVSVIIYLTTGEESDRLDALGALGEALSSTESAFAGYDNMMSQVFSLPGLPSIGVFDVIADDEIIRATQTHQISFTVQNDGVGTAEGIYVKAASCDEVSFVDGDSLWIGDIPANGSTLGYFNIIVDETILPEGSNEGWISMNFQPASAVSYIVPLSAQTSFDIASACDCGVWGDVNDDGQVNPIDVVYMVNFVYKNQDARIQPPGCPYEAGDVDCDQQVNPVDVVYYVNFVYKNWDAFCEPCSQ